LPDDFDMNGVRTRVREKAGAFDQLAGMFVKFYCRQRGDGGAPE
jgi:hypothetical protein